MPALIPTDYTAEIIWIGSVSGAGSIRSVPRESLTLTFDGAMEEGRHAGRNRASCSRVTSQHPKGTEIANVRQLCIVSGEEMDQIAADLELEALEPEWLGATLVLRGIPDFTHVPPSARIQAPDGATLVIDMENRPCNLVSREIEADRPGHGQRFKAAAKGKRGVTAWVERPGVLSLGDQMRLHIPDQRQWAP
ncbi:MAG: MOSC domain-containing protein [Loktanella sp.]|nr:MOSC domain-containing protein [Loktanella sp.]